MNQVSAKNVYGNLQNKISIFTVFSVFQIKNTLQIVSSQKLVNW